MNRCKSCYQNVSPELQEINETRKKLKNLKKAYRLAYSKSLPDIKTTFTSKGFNFRILNEFSVKDLTSGLTWTIQKDFKSNHHETTAKFGNSVPTKEELEVAEKHGIREVLDMKNGWFWSSSVNPYNTDFACVFNGYVGGIFYGYRGNYYGAALCVSGR